MELQMLQECIQNNQLTYGPMVSRFESIFAEILNVRHAVMCSSGTTALHLALTVAGIKPGDEVLVPDMTFVATANAVKYCGAMPVLVDIDPDNWSLSLEDAARKITPRTKAVIPVHLYGNPVNMTMLMPWAKAHGLCVIEDAAEGLGGVWNGQYLGTYGEMGTFSFYGNKVLTTGEGGAVVCYDDDLARQLRKYRGQGQTSRRYFHDVVGFNYRMTDLQAAVGLGQIYALTGNLDKRLKVMRTYFKAFEGSGMQTVQEAAAPWLFTLVLPDRLNRDWVMRELAYREIETRPAFVPLHRLPMYAESDREFPVSCALGDRGLSLPTFPDLSLEDAQSIATQVLEITKACLDA